VGKGKGGGGGGGGFSIELFLGKNLAGAREGGYRVGTFGRRADEGETP